MNIKQYFIVIAILLAVGFGLSMFFSKPTASLVLDYGNGEVRKFTGEVTAYMTVLDALSASSKGDDFKVEYSENNQSSESISIDGKNPVIIKLNGRPVQLNMISETMIAHGDLIEIELHE